MGMTVVLSSSGKSVVCSRVGTLGYSEGLASRLPTGSLLGSEPRESRWQITGANKVGDATTDVASAYPALMRIGWGWPQQALLRAPWQPLQQCPLAWSALSEQTSLPQPPVGIHPGRQQPKELGEPQPRPTESSLVGFRGLDDNPIKKLTSVLSVE
jgi:hypothetical protein